MKKSHLFYANAALIAVLCQFSNIVQAESSDKQVRRGPPQAALDACESLTSGDACSFTSGNDEQLSGTCFAPANRDLACKPEGHDRRQSDGRRGDSQDDS